jgi:hypothetical protein
LRRWLAASGLDAGARVQAMTAAQRYAAALAIFADSEHFRRRPSVLTPRGIIQGGYRPLDPSQVAFRQAELFLDQLNSTMVAGAVRNNAAACITRLTRALEALARAPPRTIPGPALSILLRKAAKPVSPAGARDLLHDLRRKRTGGPLLTPGDRMPSRPSTLPHASAVSAKSGESPWGDVTPWSAAVLSEASTLAETQSQNRVVLREEQAGRAGKSSLRGRVDLRAVSGSRPVICLDSRRTAFSDDAFSLSPSTGEVFVHVVDAVSGLRPYPALRTIASERMISSFTPAGPLHMLPPAALTALRFAPGEVCEAVTVGLSVDASRGRLLGVRVFPSVVGPIVRVDAEAAEEALATGDVSLLSGVTLEAASDLLSTARLIDRVQTTHPWVGAHLAASRGVGRQHALDRDTGMYSLVPSAATPVARLVNALLTLYSNATSELCMRADLALPLTWESRDRHDPRRVRRFATQPLRSWISQLQQHQVRAALRLGPPLTRSECAIAVSRMNAHRKDTAPLLGAVRRQTDWEALAAHLTSLQKSGAREPSLRGQVAGPGTVRLPEFGVTGRLLPGTLDSFSHLEMMARGTDVRVRVVELDAAAQSLTLQLISQ